MDEATRNLITSGENITMNMFIEIAPNFAVPTLAKRVHEMALDMGYNLKGINSKDRNNPITIEKFSLEGDVTTDREWTQSDSEKLLEILTTSSTLTLRELVKEFNAPSTLVTKHLKVIGKEHDIRIKGLGTKVPKGGNRLDCLIMLESGAKDKMQNGLIDQYARRKTGIQRYKVAISTPDGVQKVTMRAKSPEDAMKKAEAMFKGSKAIKVLD